LEKGLAGEGNQADASAALALHIILYGKLGALKPVGADIGGEHAAGAIQQKKGVAAQKLAGEFLLAPLRAGEGQANARHREQLHGIFQGAPQGAVGASEGFNELRSGQLR